MSNAPTRTLSREALRQVTEAAGWSLERVIERPFAYNVRRVKRHVA